MRKLTCNLIKQLNHHFICFVVLAQIEERVGNTKQRVQQRQIRYFGSRVLLSHIDEIGGGSTGSNEQS